MGRKSIFLIGGIQCTVFFLIITVYSCNSIPYVLKTCYSRNIFKRIKRPSNQKNIASIAILTVLLLFIELTYYIWPFILHFKKAHSINKNSFNYLNIGHCNIYPIPSSLSIFRKFIL